ncbi:MAG: hypothetical protein AAFY76_02830 [Cyanobacteria bacterium J06649_11]
MEKYNDILVTYFQYVPSPESSILRRKALSALEKILAHHENFNLKIYIDSVTGITANIIRKSLSKVYFESIEDTANRTISVNAENKKLIVKNDRVDLSIFDSLMIEGLINSIWLDNYTHYNRQGELLTSSGWDQYFIYGEEFLHHSYLQISYYVLISEAVLARIEELRDHDSLNYVEFARLGELALVIAASTYITAYSLHRDLTKISLDNLDESFDQDGMVENINIIYRNSASVINLEVSDVAHLEHLSSEVIKENIKSTFNTYSLIWSKFDIPEFGAELSNRRIQFELFTNASLHPSSIDMNLVNSLEDILKIKNYLGLTSSLLISEYLKKISDLTSLYFSKAANLAIDSQFDAIFAKQLAYTTLLYHQRAIEDASYLVKLVIDEKETENSFLYKTISSAPERSIFTSLFNLSKTYDRIADEKQLSKMKSVLESIPEVIQNPLEKRKSINLFNWIEASNEIKNISEKQAIALLKRWSDRKDLFFYASILYNLFNRGFQSEYFRKEVIDVVRSPGDKTFSTYLLLANTYAQRFFVDAKTIDPYEFQIIMTFLQTQIDYWESVNDVFTNSEIYYTLQYFNQEQYHEKYLLWSKLETEVFHKSYVVKMLEEDRHFMVFKDYVNRALRWGLQLDCPLESYTAKINLNPQESFKYIKSVSKSSHIPSPIASGKVNTDFVAIGNALIKNINSLSSAQLEVLKNINSISRQSLPQLIDLLLSMPRLPAYFKQVMENYYRYFDFYSRR